MDCLSKQSFLPKTATACSLHPVVLFEILDHFTRRNAHQSRVVGALLGNMNADGTVNLRNSFPMPQDESNTPDFDQFFETMSQLHRKVNMREHLVGFYVTAKADEEGIKDEVGEEDLPLQAFFENKIGDKQPCVMLRVDANIQNAEHIGVSTFTSSPLVIRGDKNFGEKDLGRCFNRVPCAVRTYEAERIRVDFITQNTIGQGGGEELGSDLEKLESCISKLTMMMDSTLEHVDAVIDGKVPADTRIGRALAEAVAAVPPLSSSELEGAFSKSLQDLLMVQYLSAIAQSQLCFWQKLQSMQ
jgi:translation initiation factor 3 subunit F